MRMLKPWLLLVLMAALSACGGDEPKPPPDEPKPPPYTGPSHGTGILRSNAHVLPAEQAEGSTLTLDTLTVRKPQSRRFSPGEVVILDAHEGRLLEITSVSETQDTITYHYTLASIAQAFEKLDVSFSGKLTPEELGATIDTGDPSLEATWITREGPSSESGTRTSQQVSFETHVLQIKYKKFAGQVGSGIELDGTVSFLLNPDFSLRLEPIDGQELPNLEMSAVISPELKTSVSVASLYGGQISFIADRSFELPAIKRTILVPVLGVPVPVPFWVKPVVTLSAAVNGTAGSKFTTTHKFGVSGSLGFRRTMARGLEPVADYSTTSEVSVSDIESEFGINLTAPKVEIHFQLYGVAGPTMDVGLQYSLTGKSAMGGSPPVEGVEVVAATKLVANAGLKASREWGLDAVKKLLGKVSVEYTPFSIKLVDRPTAPETKWFFPYRKLEVALPEPGLYAYTDPSASGFSSLTAKIKNAIPGEVMKDGTLIASVKFHRNGCFKPDLSGEFTRGKDGQLKPACQNARLPQEEMTRSLPLPVSQLESGQAREFTFQFQTPIPMSATDVYLRVVYQGSLGSDPEGMRTAVGTRDISEPTFVGADNAMDVYQLPLFPGYGFFPPKEIKENITQAPYRIVDYNRNGQYDPPNDYNVDGGNLSIEMRIRGQQKTTRIATIPVLAPGRYSRVALLADTQPLTVQFLVNGMGFNNTLAEYRLRPKKAQVNPERCSPSGPPCTFVDGEVDTVYTMRNRHHYWSLNVVHGYEPMWMDYEDIPVSLEPDADKPVPASLYPSPTLVTEPRVLSQTSELTSFEGLLPGSFSLPRIQVRQFETHPGY